MSRRKLSNIAKEIRASTKIKPKKEKEYVAHFDKVVSTGSTLLDLACTGRRMKFGGIPGGILCEISGKAALGKTAILSEMASCINNRGGEADFGDPEARLDKEYCKTYGLELDKNHYFIPDTVEDIFERIAKFKPKNEEALNAICVDSLAALSTKVEMEKEDKRGQLRAKLFSQYLRKQCRKMEKSGVLIACSNQIRQGDYGDVTPGGEAIKFYSSLRISLKLIKKVVIEKTIKLGKKSKVIKATKGIHVLCTVIKSSIDEPFRTAEIYLMFNYGIDDIRANLQYVKDITGDTVYNCCDGKKTYQSIVPACKWVEKYKLEKKLKRKVVKIWNQVQDTFEDNRKPKVRD